MTTSKNYFDILDDEVPKKSKVEVLKDGNNTPASHQKKPRSQPGAAPVIASVALAPLHKENTAPRHKVEDRNKLGGAQRGRDKTFHSHSDEAARPGHRQFDRRGGPDSHERSEARKHGKRLGDNSSPSFDKDIAADVVNEISQPVVEEKKEETVPQEVENTLTYDEFLAQKRANLVADAQEARQVKIDDVQWKKVKPLEKLAMEEKTAALLKQTKSNKKIVTLSEFASGSATSHPSGNHRDNDNRNRRDNFNLHDQSAFPSLQ